MEIRKTYEKKQGPPGAMTHRLGRVTCVDHGLGPADFEPPLLTRLNLGCQFWPVYNR